MTMEMIQPLDLNEGASMNPKHQALKMNEIIVALNTLLFDNEEKNEKE